MFLCTFVLHSYKEKAQITEKKAYVNIIRKFLNNQLSQT